ncbi:MAG TPA: glycosyltransferase family 2 protein [Candidatus Saccharimonadales bacterium]|nr:glycosyltransferase family 2 protein [Candidatus Saccharimonadales bacterium]
MKRFSTLAGPIQRLPKEKPPVVHFKSILSYESPSYRVWAITMVGLAFLLVIMFAGILFLPAHWVAIQEPNSPVHLQNILMLGILMLLQVLVIIGAFSAARSTLKARDPIPMPPQKGLRVAFITTRAPGEPVSIVRKTLEAARRVSYTQGTVDVWLLDETDDPELRELCASLGVHHFSRKGVERWNTPKPTTSLRSKLQRLLHPKAPRPAQPDPFYAARTKHGNLNAWGTYVSEQGYRYDIMAGVDTDQVPEPNFLLRLLGYFRDPDVAFVVGPQVYGNYGPGLGGLVARWAESQASFFQSTIQRAGNASQSPMFVGTNYAVRTTALDQINGIQPCITEDMATGIAIHAERNPDTNNHWKSVYTPDVLAIGEGPDSWGPYFTQQWRWAAGAFDTWRRSFWKIIFKAHPRTKLHYVLIMTYYPIAALTWLLAVISSAIFLTTGATAVIAPWSEFISLYLMATIMQLSLYFWNRRYNVSPHEAEGSWGVPGIVLSSLAAPIYFSALWGILSGKKPGFVVTQKGSNGVTLDSLASFRTHLQWAAVLMAALAYGAHHGHMHPAMVVWSLCLLAVCFAPLVIATSLAVKVRLQAAKKARSAPRLILGEETNHAQ